MLAAFCLRLSLGLVAFLPLLPADKMHPRFFRTQFLTALGLSIVALLTGKENDLTRFAVSACAVVVAFCGAVVWTLEPPPWGRTIGWLSTIVYLVAVGVFVPRQPSWTFWIDGIASGLFLGATVTAMLVGHSYLISPGLTLRPLLTMLAVVGVCWVIRLVFLVIVSIPYLTLDHTRSGPIPFWEWFVPRCLIGLIGPFVFGIMAYRAAKLNSTQSATGILYVVVICTILGELLGIIIAAVIGTPA